MSLPDRLVLGGSLGGSMGGFLLLRSRFARGSFLLGGVCRRRVSSVFFTASSRLRGCMVSTATRPLLDSSSAVLRVFLSVVPLLFSLTTCSHRKAFCTCSPPVCRCSLAVRPGQPVNQQTNAEKLPGKITRSWASQHRRSRSVPEVPSFLGTPKPLVFRF